MKAFIKLGTQTKNHATALRALGYEVQTDGENIITEVTGTVSYLDLTSGPDALVQLIREQKALTYGSKVTMFDEKTGENKVFTGVPLCLKLVGFSKKLGLPNLSCLVMKTGEAKAKAPAAQVPAEWASLAALLKR